MTGSCRRSSALWIHNQAHIQPLTSIHSQKFDLLRVLTRHQDRPVMESEQRSIPLAGFRETRIQNNPSNSGAMFSEMHGGHVIAPTSNAKNICFQEHVSGFSSQKSFSHGEPEQGAVCGALEAVGFFHIPSINPVLTIIALSLAGVGKTCLAYATSCVVLKSLMIQHSSLAIQSILDISTKAKQGDTRMQVGFLYLTYKEQPSVNHMLGSLAKQLIGTSHDMAKVFRELWNKDRLLAVLVSESDTYVIVDALDEIDSRKRGELLSRICQMNIRLLVTSRYLEGFKSMTESFQTVKVEAQKEDIDNYVDLAIAESSRLSAFILRDPSLEEKIKMKINQRADGIFLMVRLHMEAIAVSLTSTEVRSILETLPSDPNSTPLNVQELRHALATQPGKPVFDHGRMLLEEDILSFCCGLVEIDSNLQIEFLESVKEEIFPDFNTYIATACATYLCLDRLELSKEAHTDFSEYEDASLHTEDVECM
ncbi:hypothetical protein IWZ00DRAFT_489580 [Phyllosticta capitalensis]